MKMTDHRLLGFRSEARGVPNLLVAPRSPLAANTTAKSNSSSPDRYYNNTSNGGGYYADGAYVAVPDVDNVGRNGRVAGNAAASGDRESSGGDVELDPQEAYYISLLERYTALENTLRSPPVAEFSTPPSVESIHSIRKWRWVLLHRRPTMGFFSQLPQESIINGLAALESLLQRGDLRKNVAQRSEQLQRLQRLQRLGAWPWGLLAKCRDVGEMGSEEVGVLRGLGKMAWWVMREIKAGVGDGVMGEEGEEEEDEKEGGEEDGEIRDEEIKDEDGADDGAEEEGEVHSGADEEDSGDDDDGDNSHEDNMNVENDQDLISSSNHIPPPSITTNASTTITATISDPNPTTDTTNINVHPSSLLSSLPRSPPKIPSPQPPPPSMETPIPISNGRTYSPSPLSPSGDRDQGSPVCHNNDENEPSDPDLAAARQRLLNQLISTSKPKMDEPDQRSELQNPAKLEEQQHQYSTLPPPSQYNHIPIPNSNESTTHEINNEQQENQQEDDEEEEKTKMTMSISATMDMILTIVGERYGQRDLLVGRGFWGE